MLDQILSDLLQRHVGAVLRRDDHGLDRHRLAVDVAHRYLALAVRPEVLEHAALPHRREPLHELVREHDRQRHQLLGLGARVAEHQALVAGPQLVHAHRDVAGLLVDGRDDTAGLVVEAVLGARVADRLDGLASDLRNVHVAGRGDLARHDDEPGGQERLAGHATRRVLGQDRVQDGVGDLVGDLVRMPLGHGLRSEQVLLTRHRVPPWSVPIVLYGCAARRLRTRLWQSSMGAVTPQGKCPRAARSRALSRCEESHAG